MLRPHLLAALALTAALTPGAPPRAPVPASPHEGLRAARAALDRELATAVRPAPLWLRRADLDRALGDLAAALRDLDEADAHGAPAHEVEAGRAAVHLAAGDGTQAAAAAERALAAHPDDGELHALRARAALLAGRYQVAADHLGRALELGAARPLDLVLARAEALARTGEGGDLRALALLDAELERRGPLPALVLAAVECERRRGAWEAALARLAGLRAAGWSAAEHGLAAGDVLAEAGRWPEAARAWAGGRAALDAAPPRRRATAAALRLRATLERRLAAAAGRGGAR